MYQVNAETLALYNAAADKWGEDSQIDMATEELTECSLALQKLFKRDYSLARREELAGEIADVRITLSQVINLMDNYFVFPGADGLFSELVEEKYQYKLARLAKRVYNKE